MPRVEVNTKKATVTKVCPFQTRMGPGVNFYVEAKSDIGTVYLQVVLYDERARKALLDIHKDNLLDISGSLKYQMYQKKDGTTGYSLVIENPEQLTVHKNPADTASQELQSNTSQLDYPEDAEQQSVETAETDQQDLHAVTAQQQAAEQHEQVQQPKRYPPLPRYTEYRPPLPYVEIDDDLPF